MIRPRPATSFLIPWRSDGGWRDQIFQCVWERLGNLMTDMSLTGEAIIWGDDGKDPGLFNRPRAINNCAAQARGNVFVILDADTTYREKGALKDAIAATHADNRWRLPETYLTLTEEATRNIVARRSSATILDGEIEYEGGTNWSGIVIIPAEAFWKIRGADERYLGWGADDIALGLALDQLHGKHVRYPGAAVHLWHPRGTQENGLHEHGDAGRDLTARYVAAAENREMMQAVVDEKEKRERPGT